MSKTLLAIVGLTLFLIVASIFPAISQNLQNAFAFVLNLSDYTFSNTVRQNNLVLVEFWNPNCSACQKMISPLQQLSKYYGNSITFARLNIIDNSFIKDYYQIKFTPTFILFENGYPSYKIVGAKIKDLNDLLFKINNKYAQKGYWELKVNVNDIPNNIYNMIVTVKGPFNEQTSKAIYASSKNTETVFDIPDDKIPNGYNFKVCIRESGGKVDWCSPFIYNGIPEAYVTVNWPHLPTSPSSGISVCPTSYNVIQGTDEFEKDYSGLEPCNSPSENNYDFLDPSD